MERMRRIPGLLWDFMTFGLFTFGGGWSIVAQMRQKFIVEQKTLTDEELVDLTSVAKSIPGTMVGNVAMLYGYRVAGFPGGVAAVLGMSLPPMAVLVIISFFYQAFRSNYWVNAAMSGMQAAVVPIIVSAAISMVKGSVKYPPCLVITAICLGLYLWLPVSPVVLVLVGAVCGLGIGEYYARKEGKSHGPA